MTKEYPDFQGMGEDLTPAYITPHVGEYSPVTPKTEEANKQLQEAMELIKSKIFASNMSRKDIREVMSAMQFRERILQTLR